MRKFCLIVLSSERSERENKIALYEIQNENTGLNSVIYFIFVSFSERHVSMGMCGEQLA